MAWLFVGREMSGWLIRASTFIHEKRHIVGPGFGHNDVVVPIAVASVVGIGALQRWNCRIAAGAETLD